VLDRLRRTAVRVALAAPRPLLAALAGGPVRRDGLTLDPQVAAALAAARAAGIRSLEELGDVATARDQAERVLGAFDAAPRPMARVTDTAAPGPGGPIPVRVYRPRGAAPALIVFFHGGGGVIGTLDGYDPVCRLLADLTGCQLASVAYRLAPEHVHPAAVDDARAAWRWAGAAAPELGVDPTRLALAGDSFGGFLSATVERTEREPGAPRPRAVALIYPLLDLTLSSPSIETFADGFVLTRPLMAWFRDLYCPDPGAWRAASPRFWDDLAGAPTTIVSTAGFDPLRDEGRRWADRLAGAGAHVIHRPADTLVHGFLEMTGAIREARARVAELAADLRAELAP
jgi:acetyl esterase/lipase